MKFQVDGLTVYWPFEYCYPEQYEYMVQLKRALDAKKHGILEMPTGTGKTVTLLAFIVSYQLQRPQISKLIYCTRTVGEISKVLEELRKVAAYRDEQIGPQLAEQRPITALGLTTRRNLCLHEAVAKANSREEADSACREMTASWVRDKPKPDIQDIENIADPTATKLCQYFEGFKLEGEDSIIPTGIYTLDDIMEFGRKTKWCPYYTARHALNHANVVVYNYQYLLDPKIAGLISSKLAKECIVVFDEAHNIDTVCVDALSVSLRDQTLRKGIGNIQQLSKRIEDIKDQDASRLQVEYQRLVEGIASNGLLPPSVQDATNPDQMPAAPVIPEHIREETVPGSMRKSEHFVGFLRRLIGFLREKMKIKEAVQLHPARMLQDMASANLDEKSLRIASERLKSLLISLEVVNMAQYTPIQLICDFVTLLGTYGHERKFAIIYEPFDERLPQIPDQVLQLTCLDASLAIKPVFDKFQSVILTSGTISPLPLYATILGFKPVVSRSFTMSLNRRCILPMVVARGADQIEISSRYETRMDKSVIRNFGALLIEFAEVVPDGIVVFFTSYIYMETVLQKWSELDIINTVLRKKLVFIETPDSLEASLALENYRKACDTGRGAVFLCVARGKVAEGIDFDRHYGRCVIMMGVPFQYTESRVLKARLDYMREYLQVKEGDYLSFDAMRQASQCIGRVIRSKSDYGIMVLADKRFVRSDKKNKLPEWIQSNMDAGQVDLDTEMALAIARSFLRQMAQPLGKDSLVGSALLDEAHLKELTDDGRVAEVRSGGMTPF